MATIPTKKGETPRPNLESGPVPAACCTPKAQAVCCEPSAKATCCGPAPAPGLSCGCRG